MKKLSEEANIDSQSLVAKIVLEHLKEQKRKRFGRWISRSLILIVLLLIFFKFFSADELTENAKKPHVGLIDVNGKIADDQAANADFFLKSLKLAYKQPELKAIIIRINSPGGSPVQADYMFSTLRAYRKAFPKIKIYAVCSDACTSAAYYIAAAADEIYANEASIVGSIGVLFNGFGFVDSLKKLGVTRRLVTAGAEKGIFDPFSPVSPYQEQYLQVLLDSVHARFIEQVKKGRGQRLKIDKDSFSGLFWTGKQAKEKGLIDGFASANELATEKLNIDVIIDYTAKQSLLLRLGKNLGEALTTTVMHSNTNLEPLLNSQLSFR